MIVPIATSDKAPFWMVWSPRGRTKPQKRHLALQAAVQEADRLSKLNPGRHFYVLECLGFVMDGPEVSAPVAVADASANA